MMDDVYENINDYNPKRDKKKVLIVVDDMIADNIGYKKFQVIIKELFIRCRKLNISPAFYHSVLFFCSKRYKIKLITLFDYEKKQQNRIKKYCN